MSQEVTQETLDNARRSGFANHVLATPGFDEESATSLAESYEDQFSSRTNKYKAIAESITDALTAE